MSHDRDLGVQAPASPSECALKTIADPDRLPDIQPDAKLLSPTEVIEIEKRTARARRAARSGAGSKA